MNLRRQVILSYIIEWFGWGVIGLSFGLALVGVYRQDIPQAGTNAFFGAMVALVCLQIPRFRRFLLTPFANEQPRALGLQIKCPRCGEGQFAGKLGEPGITCQNCQLQIGSAVLEFGVEGPALRMEPLPGEQTRLH